MRQLCLLVCCLAACGDDGVRHVPDAAPHDGPIADMAPDGPLQPVTVTATIDGAPQAGVQVYFLDADSSLVLSTTTDATGTASAVMAAGGSVTALDPYAGPLPPQTAIAGGSHSLYTFVGVKPGDNLVLANPGEHPGIDVTVTVPIDPAAGVASYEVHTPCGGGNTLTDPGSGASPSGLVGIGPDCGATTDFLIVTRDDNFQVLDYAYVPDQAISEGATIDLTAATYAAGSTREYSYTNVPATFGSPSFTDAILTPQGDMLAQFNYASPDEPTPVVTAGIGTHLSVTDIFGASAGNHHIADWGPYTDTYTADLGARTLHDLNGFPHLDPTTHEISLDESAGGAEPDLMLAGIYTYREADNTDWYWQIAAPHATTLAMPALPTDLYDFTIAPTDTFDANQLMLAKVPGGYDAVRAYVFALTGPTSVAQGSSGSAAVEEVIGKLARKGRPGVR
jgi:hypothetical protein